MKAVGEGDPSRGHSRPSQRRLAPEGCARSAERLQFPPQDFRRHLAALGAGQARAKRADDACDCWNLREVEG